MVLDLSILTLRCRAYVDAPLFFYRFPMSRKRLNKEALIADAFFSPTCRFDFVGLNIRQSFERKKGVRAGKRRGRERVTPERVTKCLSSREERADDGAAGFLSPHTLFPSTLRRDTRVGLTDLPRNANRYTQYTQRESTPRCDTSTDALLGNVHTSETYLPRRCVCKG